MASDTCGLGQALLYLEGNWELVSEQRFRAVRKAGDLPKDRALQDAIILAVMDGRLPHSGRLVVMDFEYVEDLTGKTERREVEVRQVKKNYSAAEEAWDIDRVDFYASFLDVIKAPKGYRVLKGIDRPWYRLKDIKVPTAELSQISRAPRSQSDQSHGGSDTRGSLSKPRSAGGRLTTKDWDLFWTEIVCFIYRDGILQDNDADWAELNQFVRKTFTDIDESSMMKRVRALRRTLRDLGYIKATGE